MTKADIKLSARAPRKSEGAGRETRVFARPFASDEI
jgi:hypothetical protein